MIGPAARFVGIALAAASVAAAAPASAAPASSGFEEGLAAYQKNDFEKSLKLLQPLAEKGDARAQYLLGRQYQFGQAVKVDRAEAYYWYRRAEAKGHQEAKLFRVLLEKRWNISTIEKGRAEKALAADNAPKPAPVRVGQIESRPQPKPERAAVEEPKVRERPKLPPSLIERAKPEPAKPAVETARVKLPDPPKTETPRGKPEPVRVKAPDQPAPVVASLPEESRRPVPRREVNETARSMPRATIGDEDEGEASVARRYATPPETRTAVAAVPNTPPPSEENPSEYAPDYPPAPYGPPATGYPPPPPPYYGPGPGPYYAPGAPGWRASVRFGPRPYYAPPWGYRPYGGYIQPGWRSYRARW